MKLRRHLQNQTLLLGALAVALLLIDQISKAVVRSSMQLGEYISIIGDFFGFSYSQNTGAAFGIFSNGTVVLSVLAALMALACLWLFLNTRILPALNNFVGRLALILLFCGACGNLIDRICCGYVTDWIKLSFIPNFNVADSCISIAVFIIIMFIAFPLLFKKDNHV